MVEFVLCTKRLCAEFWLPWPFSVWLLFYNMVFNLTSVIFSEHKHLKNHTLQQEPKVKTLLSAVTLQDTLRSDSSRVSSALLSWSSSRSLSPLPSPSLCLKYFKCSTTESQNLFAVFILSHEEKSWFYLEESCSPFHCSHKSQKGIFPETAWALQHNRLQFRLLLSVVG